eukprot:jgi/Botrbrau1/1185/Bobra.0162s0066.1
MWSDCEELDDVDWDAIERQGLENRRKGVSTAENADCKFSVPLEMQAVPAAIQVLQAPFGTGICTPLGNVFFRPELPSFHGELPTIQEISSKVNHFKQWSAGQPPPLPKEDKCPGVFKSANTKNCGQPLFFTSQHHDVNGQCITTHFWYCRMCDFKEYIPIRHLTPRLAFEVVDNEKFKVESAPGAEECVAACGGVRTILSAICSADILSLLEAPSLQVEFPLKAYEEVVRQVSRASRQDCEFLGPGSLIPGPVLSAFRGNHLQGADDMEHRYRMIPPSLEAALMPFQKDGVLFGLQRSGRILIADEMGVGKTLQAIALVSCYMEEWPVLVVAPASLRLIWAEELEKWLPCHVRPSAMHVIEGRADRIRPGVDKYQIVITSYEMLQRLTCDACRCGGTRSSTSCSGPEGCMAAQGWKVVVVDESHTMRTTEHVPDAKHTEAVASVVKRACRAVMLSGTPGLNRPFDLFRQVDALRPGLLTPCRQQFSIRYCNRQLVPTPGRRRDGVSALKYNHSGVSHAAELHALLKQEVMVRRLKKEVADQLPEKRRQVVRLPKPRLQDWPTESKRPRPESGEDASADEEEEQEEEDEEEEEDADSKNGTDADQMQEATGKFSPSHRTGLAKLPSVIEWLAHALGRASATTACLESSTKFLIFAHHKDVMAKLAEALSGEGPGKEWGSVPFVRIDGGTDSFDRRAAVNRFRDDPNVRAALLSVTAAGTGLDFSKASVVVFVELPHEVSLIRQAEDRAHRHGQQNPVNVYFLVSRGTTDERRWQHLNRSLERLSAVHDGKVMPGDEGPDDRRGLHVDGVHDMEQRCLGLTQLSHPRPLNTKGEHSDEVVDLCSPDDLGSESIVSGPSVGYELHPLRGVATPKFSQETVDSSLGEEKQERLHSHVIDPEAGESRENQSVVSTDQMMNASMEGSQNQMVDSSILYERSAGSQPLCANGDKVTQQIVAFEGGKDTDQTLDCSSCEVEAYGDAVGVSFEVSLHTNRVHLHGKEGPMGLSLPLDLLLLAGMPSSLLQVLEALPAGPPYNVKNSSIGVLALSLAIPQERMQLIFQEAQLFAKEWVELRAVVKSKLCGQLLCRPLEDHVEKLEEQAVAEGAYGISKERYRTTSDRTLPLPPGAVWRTVRVQYPSGSRMCDYQQPFRSDTERLCIMCCTPVTSCRAPYEVLLIGAANLFCSAECEKKYCLQANRGAMRRALFKLERGICQMCRLDCHALVQALRCIEKGSPAWRDRRLQKLMSLSSKFGRHGYKAISDRLIGQALDGNAWHADHVLPVFKGGGLCDLQNLRTLCVACHQDITKQQAKERADTRRDDKQLPITSFFQPKNPDARPWRQLSLKARAAMGRQGATI